MELHLDPDDVAASAKAQGVTVIGRGTAVEARGTDFDGAAIVSEHERLHVSLNNATSFGTLLHGCATHKPTSLAALVDACRTTHEVYATYLSVWLGRKNPAAFLAGYPTYLRYYELGCRLAKEFVAGSVITRCVISAACQVAMQPPIPGAAAWLQDVAAETSIFQAARPDQRLALLIDRRIELAALVGDVPDSWREVSLPEALQQGGEEALGPSFNDASRELTRTIYEAFASEVRRAGLSCLDWDGQCDDPDVAAVRQLGQKPWLPLPLGLGRQQANEMPLPGPNLTLRYLDTERWLQRDAHSPLLAIPFDDIPKRGEGDDLRQGHFIADMKGASHILLIVRPLDLLLEQYAMDAESAAQLRVAATAGVVTAVRLVGYEKDTRLTVLGLLSRSAQLRYLAKFPTDLGILGSISLAAAFLPAWQQRWLPAVHAHSHVFLLCDMALSHWLEAAEAEATPPRLRYMAGRIETESDTPTEVLAIDYLEAEGKVDRRLMVLGSPPAVHNLRRALENSEHLHALGDEHFFAESPVWRAVLTRLLTEEPWFDRRALEYLARSRPKA